MPLVKLINVNHMAAVHAALKQDALKVPLVKPINVLNMAAVHAVLNQDAPRLPREKLKIA